MFIIDWIGLPAAIGVVDAHRGGFVWEAIVRSVCEKDRLRERR